MPHQAIPEDAPQQQASHIREAQLSRGQINDCANQQPRPLQHHQRQVPAGLAPVVHNPCQRNQHGQRRPQAPERRGCQQNIAQDRAYILQHREIRDITGLQDYKDLMDWMNGRKAMPPRQIVVCLPQNTNEVVYADFVTFLNRLLHEHRPRGGSIEVNRCHQARRIIYNTTIDPNIFQGLLNQADQCFFG